MTPRALSIPLAFVLALTLACGKDDDSTADEASSANTSSGAIASSGAADLRAAIDYELTMPKVEKYYEAMKNIALASKTVSEEEKSSLNAGNATLDQYAEQLESNAKARKAIEDAGLSAREFAVITMAMLHAGMVAGISQMPGANIDSLARANQVNMKNVEFMKTHSAELEAKQKQMSAELERAGVRP